MIVTITLNPAVDETLIVRNLQLGETNRIKATDIDPGGKGLNVARMVKRLGRPVVAIAFVGGPTGDFIRNRLEREDVETDLVEIERTTRVNISVLDEVSGVQTNLNHEGAPIDAADMHALERKISEWLPETVVLAIGGSLPPGAPPDTYERIIRWARESEVRTLLDTSGSALAEGIKAQPYMIKPNVRETEELLGRKLETDADIVAAGDELVARGIHTVVISMGKRGAIAVTSDEAWKAIPPPVEPGSTIGAGDAMVAGLVIGLAEHSGLPQSLALGTAAGVATVMTPGTELGTAEAVQEFLPQVKVEKIR